MKKLLVEWKHFDKYGKTCDRCSTTGASLKKIIDEYLQKGIKISLVETLLTEKEISDSNSLTFNGEPIETLLGITSSTNCCDSCSDLTGKPTNCRTLQTNNNNYEAIPKEIIEKAINKLLSI